MNNTVCEENRCLGCYACVSACSRKAISIIDNMQDLNAVIDLSICIKCGQCHKVCQVNSECEKQEPKEWYQGWATKKDIRMAASSGGVATAIGEWFISQNGIVCSCAFENGEFHFKFAKSVEELSLFQGSKYVKSKTEGAFSQIEEYLKQGIKVLFIGLPCQVGGLKKFISEELQFNLYTIDLICHGTPSVKTLEKFLNEHGYQLNDLQHISFRERGKFTMAADHSYIVPYAMDRYSIAFMNGMCYTGNCYSCEYARLERVSDLTVGDSWGSDLSTEVSNGVSLMLCQTMKGSELVKSADLTLKDVDLNHAVSQNSQLDHPFEKPAYFPDFFEDLKKHPFDRVVYKYARWKCIKQLIKRGLITLRLKRGYTSNPF